MKDLITAVLAIIVVVLIIRLQKTEQSSVETQTELHNRIAFAEVKSDALMDSVNGLNLKRDKEKQSYLTSLRNYQAKPTKERIKFIHLIDSSIVITDSSATLTEAQVDSINRLRIAYVHTRMELSIYDTTSKLKDTIITQKDTIIATQKKALIMQRKQHKKEKLKAFAIGVGVGIITSVFVIIIGS